MQQRKQVQELEKKFIDSTQKYFTKMTNFLDRHFRESLKVCRTPECHSTLKTKYLELEHHSANYFEFMSNQLELCIEREATAKGIEGYRKCFRLFESILEVESKKKLFD